MPKISDVLIEYIKRPFSLSSGSLTTFLMKPTMTSALWVLVIILTVRLISTKRESLFKAVTNLSEGRRWDVSLRMNLRMKLLWS